MICKAGISARYIWLFVANISLAEASYLLRGIKSLESRIACCSLEKVVWHIFVWTSCIECAFVCHLKSICCSGKPGTMIADQCSQTSISFIQVTSGRPIFSSDQKISFRIKNWKLRVISRNFLAWFFDIIRGFLKFFRIKNSDWSGGFRAPDGLLDLDLRMTAVWGRMSDVRFVQ